MRNWMLLTRGAMEYHNGTISFLGVTRQDLLRDLSLALSRLYRSGGRRKWSVAQHSMLVAREAPEHLQLEALVHDIEEPMTGDMPKPWLDQLPDFVREGLAAARRRTRYEILRFLGIPSGCVETEEIRKADMRAFSIEVHYFDYSNLHKVEKDFGLTVPAVETRTIPLPCWNCDESTVADTWYAMVAAEMKKRGIAL